LLKEDRLTLMKSTLSNLSTYQWVWLIGLRNFSKILRFFLWGGINEELKFHLVKWLKICSPKQAGGLRVINLTKFNQALLGEWLWLYATEREAL